MVEICNGTAVIECKKIANLCLSDTDRASILLSHYCVHNHTYMVIGQTPTSIFYRFTSPFTLQSGSSKPQCFEPLFALTLEFPVALRVCALSSPSFPLIYDFAFLRAEFKQLVVNLYASSSNQNLLYTIQSHFRLPSHFTSPLYHTTDTIFLSNLLQPPLHPISPATFAFVLYCSSHTSSIEIFDLSHGNNPLGISASIS